MKIKITPNEKGNPPSKLADVELHFDAADMVPGLAGLKLIGFAIWERRGGSGRNVTFPARQYSINGERRSFALLRPITDSTAQNTIRDLILEAFAEWEEQAAQDATTAPARTDPDGFVWAPDTTPATEAQPTTEAQPAATTQATQPKIDF